MDFTPEKCSVSMTLQITATHDERLAVLAKKNKRSKAYFVREALDFYMYNCTDDQGNVTDFDDSTAIEVK